MKIVILHTDFRIYWPARLRALAKYLYQKGNILHIIEIAGAGSPYAFAKKIVTPELSWHILFPNVKMESLHRKQIDACVLNKLNELNPDIVIAGAIAFPSGALAVKWVRKHHKRVIIFDDAKKEDVKRNLLVNFIKRSVYHGVDGMFFPAPSWRQTGEYWDFKPNQLFYGVDVVDNQYWQQPVTKNETLPLKYFLCVGRQIPKKNFLFVLEAYKQYVANVSLPYHLVMVGDGPEHEKLLQYVKQNALENLVTFKPFVQQQDLVSIYRQATAFIIASICGETWGLVINEAMASGLPIIASDKCGAVSTLVINNSNGLIFSPFEKNQLVSHLLLMHNFSEDEKLKMSRNSINIIKEWGLEKFVDSLYQAILFVLDRPEDKLSIVEKCIINLWSGRYRPI